MIFLEDQISFLQQRKIEEQKLKEISLLVLSHPNKQNVIYDLLKDLPYLNNYYDWNIASILQYLLPEDVTNEFLKFNTDIFLNSAGLSWVFGEYALQNKKIVDFLYQIIDLSTNDTAWWNAAFSLEKIVDISAIALLKNSLKTRGVHNLEYYLTNLERESSVIGVLSLANSESIKDEVYPILKRVFLKEEIDTKKLMNCVWLIGRLNLIDYDIRLKMEEIIRGDKNFELIRHTLFAIRENNVENFDEILKENITHKNPSLRKIAIMSLANLGKCQYLSILEEALLREDDVGIIKEITRGIYNIKNVFRKKEIEIRRKYTENENGLIIDDSDKWYSDPSIYNIFSEAEDPENLIFKLVKERLTNDKIVIKNPIDLACGTGRATMQIMKNFDYAGCLYAVDINQKMVDFLEKNFQRNRGYIHNVKVIKSSMTELNLKDKSTFIISTFGFPSKIFDKEQCVKELEKVHNLLDDDGIFVTIGWDETFNDELSYFWYKYLPDDICAADFENWRNSRIKRIDSPRNCGLTWFKRGLVVPLQFMSIEESSYVIGHLFGRDAIEYILKNKKTEWRISMGVTYNTKKELRIILDNLEHEKI